MKQYIRSTLGILGVAAVAMVSTLSLLNPGGVNAEDEEAETIEKLEATISTTIAESELKDGDVTFTLKLDKDSYKAGDTPVVSLVAKNSSKEAVEKTIEVNLTSRDLIVRGRMMPMPQIVWTTSRTVSLKAGESKTIELKTETKLAEGKAFSVVFGGEEERLIRPFASNAAPPVEVKEVAGKQNG